ncbi:DUF4412 domain-containing protein [bacterium]|nr:DUF4412 domain-containing protein [bacterium]
MKTLRTTAIFLAFLCPVPDDEARAGFRITYDAVSYSTVTETTVETTDRRQNVLMIDEGRLRTVGGDAEGFDYIADARGGWPETAAAEIYGEGLDAAADGRPVVYILDQTRPACAEIPFLIVDGTDTGFDTAGLWIESAGEDKSMMGYRTELYRIYEGDALIREIWTTMDFGLGFDYMRVLESFEREFNKMAPQEDFDETARIFRRVKGVPLVDIEYYPGGRDVLEARTIQKKKYKDDDFRPPENYTRVSLRELAENPPGLNHSDDVNDR